MVFNVSFNNISVISRLSVLLVEESETPPSHCQTLSHNVVYSTPRSPWEGFNLKTFVVLDTDYIGNCKSNYHMITITTACWNKRFRTKNNSLKNDLMHSYCNNEICVVDLKNMFLSFCLFYCIFIMYTFPNWYFASYTLFSFHTSP